MKKDSYSGTLPDVRFTVLPGKAVMFSTLFQSGIEIEAVSGVLLGDFICSCPGFSQTYVAQKVQTIFLNSNPVDDLKTPIEGTRAVVALSAAMPGLAGAIFRKGGIHSSLRTVPEKAARENGKGGGVTVTLKLFNQIARDKSTGLLEAGVTVSGRSFVSFMKRRPDVLNAICRTTLDSKPVAPEQLLTAIEPYQKIRLTVSE